MVMGKKISADFPSELWFLAPGKKFSVLPKKNSGTLFLG